MKSRKALTQGNFDRLVAWLGEDRARAGEKYEHVRRSLIKIFVSRGCHTAEELADETINRVAGRVEEIQPSYVGDPALYFYGVANKIYLEYVRQRVRLLPPAPPAPAGDDERRRDCLEACLERLAPADRETVLQYYSEERRAKIDSRKELARRLGIAPNALRIRVHRIRAALQECVKGCVGAEINRGDSA